MSVKMRRAAHRWSVDAYGRESSAASANSTWRATAAYLYALHLNAPLLAWEYLRRNPEYRRDWARPRRAADPGAARWRLAAFENPNLDARVALPLWRPQSDTVHRLVPHPTREYGQPRPFSMWAIAGRKSLRHDGRCLLLEIVVASETTCIALPDELADGDGYAHVVRVDAHAERRWREIKLCQALLRPGRAPCGATVGARPDRVALAHLRSLQALDGALAGASQRDIAAVIFGDPRVDSGWYPDGELRAQIRYLIRRGRGFMSGGYARLVDGAAHRAPRATVTTKGEGR